MYNSMFDRDVALRLEQERNSFVSCRTLSMRARDINSNRKSREMDPESIPSEPNPSAGAMIDLAETKISLSAE
ncbi:MAG: hypothetical protein CME10_10195 [Gemmatimonadetes bacterium]|jgi:hypothetical protein|nr:hypothetical protein [Gemmatimonadota bacterium]MAN24626.1 hypothetical protein [Gemmatimonadota bacterium]